MDDNLQQQADEIEALSAIYPSEFSLIESDKWAEVIEQAEWSGYSFTNIIKVFIQPQEEEGNIHGK